MDIGGSLGDDADHARAELAHWHRPDAALMHEMSDFVEARFR